MASASQNADEHDDEDVVIIPEDVIIPPEVVVIPPEFVNIFPEEFQFAITTVLERFNFLPNQFHTQCLLGLFNGSDLIYQSPPGSGKMLLSLIYMISRVIKVKNEGGYQQCFLIVRARETVHQIARMLLGFPEVDYVTLTGQADGNRRVLQLQSVYNQKDIYIATSGTLMGFVPDIISIIGNCIICLDEADAVENSEHARLALGRFLLPNTIHQYMYLCCASPPVLSVLYNDQANTEMVTVPTIINVRLDFINIDSSAKNEVLLQMLNNDANERVIVFATRENVESVYRFLRRHGFNVTRTHGRRAQRKREEAISSFELGGSHIIVTTGLLSKGIHFVDVGLVINYDIPTNLVEYVEQVGRAGRGGVLGRSMTFIKSPVEEPLRGDLQNLLGTNGQVIPGCLE